MRSHRHAAVKPRSEIGQITLFPPVRLYQDAVDNIDVNMLLAFSDRFKQAAHAQVPGPPEDSNALSVFISLH